MSEPRRNRPLAGRRPRGRAVAATVLALAAIGGGACGGVHGEKAVRKAAFDNSRKACASTSPRTITRNFGGDPRDPRSVATVYAKNFYKPAYRRDSRAGCLAGLTRRK
jgi:hypothetical protein